jgi:Cd2+/Zn2+-exporting ATPase
MPILVSVGDYVMSGCINLTSQIEIKVMKTSDESTASKIIEMVENSNNNKAETDKFITRFSKIYTPVVLFLALLVFLIPPLFLGDVIVWLKRSLTFLVVSCPCALVISVPLAYFGGIGCSAKKGILIKGSNYLDMISKIKTIAFDKTGTLTKGTFEVVAVHPKKLNEKELLHLAAHAEKYSTHPIAKSLKQAYDNYADLDDTCIITDIEEVSGFGIKAKVNGSFIYVGDEKLMNEINIPIESCKSKGKIIHVASKKEYFGHIVISDKIRENASEVILKLRKIGINSVLVSGDSKFVTKNVANELKINDFYFELLPKDKVKIINDISKKTNKKVAFVGDGINDAPVLARSDVGIAMGGLGSDAAIESSNIVLMDDNLLKIIEVIEISKKTDIIVKENIIFSLLVKFLVLLFAFLGFAPMFLAVFADVGVTILAILNSLRILRM